MISCPKCGKENQDHYKFCLGCGNELPREASGQRALRPTPAAVPMQPGASVQARPATPAPVPVPQAPPPQAFSPPMAPPPPAPQPFAQAQPQPFVQAQPQPFVQAPAPSVPAAPAFPPTCPQCASANPRANRFCITCGYDMASAAVAVAPVVQPPPPVYAPPPQPPPQQPAVPRQVERARLVLIRPDGSEGGTHPLFDGDIPVGRDTGGLFAQDEYLSPWHATFVVQGSSITVRDESSLNGVYVRIERQQPVEIHDGDIFRIGQEILRYDALPAATSEPDGTQKLGAETDGLVGRISLVIGRDTYGNAFPVSVNGLYLGRERGDILFPEDGYVSGLHCQLLLAGGRLTLTDVGSSNGSYVRLRAPRSLKSGDFLLMGQQLFRLQVT